VLLAAGVVDEASGRRLDDEELVGSGGLSRAGAGRAARVVQADDEVDALDSAASSKKKRRKRLGVRRGDRVEAHLPSQAESKPTPLRKRRRILSKNRTDPEKWGGMCMDRQESLFCQYMVLEAFPEATYVCSDFHAGHGQVSLGAGDRRRRTDLLLALPANQSSPARLAFWNYHGLAFHGNGQHLADCPKGRAAATSTARAWGGWRPKRPPRVAGVKDGEDEADQLNELYADALSRVFPDQLQLTYQTMHECRLFCVDAVPDPSLCINRARPGPCSQAARYPTVREFLAAQHPVDSVLGLDRNKFTQEELVNWIMAAGRNSDPGVDLGGFVTLAGGRETRTGDGVLPGSFGFCHQRCRLEPELFGNFTRLQADLREGANDLGEELLAKMAGNQQTLSRTSFHRGGETISLDYFRFLVRERGLDDYDIKHLVFYRHKHYLSPFVKDMLQRRYDLRKEPGSDLMRNLLKLVLNGFYGFCSLEASNFSRTRLVTESTLASRGFGRIGIYDPRNFSVTLVGALDRGPRMTPNLLYAVSSHRPEAAIFNVLQVSGTILGESRNIFMSLILELLRSLDPRKVEIAYGDTDSCILAVSDPDLRSLVRAELVDRVDEILAGLLEDPDADLEQSGLFKIEGAPYRDARFRTGKCYALGGADEQFAFRMRSIPRKLHGSLELKHFGQDPRTNSAVVRGLEMRPTPGLEIVMQRQGKTLSHSLNLKRKMVVSSPSCFLIVVVHTPLRSSSFSLSTSALVVFCRIPATRCRLSREEHGEGGGSLPQGCCPRHHFVVPGPGGAEGQAGPRVGGLGGGSQVPAVPPKVFGHARQIPLPSAALCDRLHLQARQRVSGHG